MKTSKSIFEFEWDKGNIEKNTKHKVEDREAEEVFLMKEKSFSKIKFIQGRKNDSLF